MNDPIITRLKISLKIKKNHPIIEYFMSYPSALVHHIHYI